MWCGGGGGGGGEGGFRHSFLSSFLADMLYMQNNSMHYNIIANITVGGVTGDTGGGVGLLFQSSLSSISEMYVLFELIMSY